jgi:hypothetical protein
MWFGIQKLFQRLAPSAIRSAPCFLYFPSTTVVELVETSSGQALFKIRYSAVRYSKIVSAPFDPRLAPFAQRPSDFFLKNVNHIFCFITFAG